jgi:hypothetical protein
MNTKQINADRASGGIPLLARHWLGAGVDKQEHA